MNSDLPPVQVINFLSDAIMSRVDGLKKGKSKVTQAVRRVAMDLCVCGEHGEETRTYVMRC